MSTPPTGKGPGPEVNNESWLLRTYKKGSEVYNRYTHNKDKGICDIPKPTYPKTEKTDMCNPPNINWVQLGVDKFKELFSDKNKK